MIKITGKITKLNKCFCPSCGASIWADRCDELKGFVLYLCPKCHYYTVQVGIKEYEELQQYFENIAKEFVDKHSNFGGTTEEDAGDEEDFFESLMERSVEEGKEKFGEYGDGKEDGPEGRIVNN